MAGGKGQREEEKSEKEADRLNSQGRRLKCTQGGHFMATCLTLLCCWQLGSLEQQDGNQPLPPKPSDWLNKVKEVMIFCQRTCQVPTQPLPRVAAAGVSCKMASFIFTSPLPSRKTLYSAKACNFSTRVSCHLSLLCHVEWIPGGLSRPLVHLGQVLSSMTPAF